MNKTCSNPRIIIIQWEEDEEGSNHKFTLNNYDDRIFEFECTIKFE